MIGWGSNNNGQVNIPNDLSSGVYAAKLVDGKDEDYIPFFVVPRVG